MKSVRRWLPFALALPLFALFASLGVWQLGRLSERRATNAVQKSAFAQPAVELPAPPGRSLPESGEVVGRRVAISGFWDPAHELVVRGQAYLGTPGVKVLTPLVVDSGHAVLVLRGWLPAADGLSADLPGAVPVATKQLVSVHGLARAGQSPSTVPIRHVEYADHVRPVLATVDLLAADSLIPLHLARFFVQELPDDLSGEVPGMPVPLPPPALNDGPHALYAFQWFGFAVIALAGAIFLPMAARSKPRVPDAGPRTAR